MNANPTTILDRLADLTARADSALVAARSARGVDGHGQPLPELSQNLRQSLSALVEAGRIAAGVLDGLPASPVATRFPVRTIGKVMTLWLAFWCLTPESAASTRRRRDDAPAGIVARLRGIHAEDQRGGGGWQEVYYWRSNARGARRPGDIYKP
jgi:hypothetical protein